MSNAVRVKHIYQEINVWKAIFIKSCYFYEFYALIAIVCRKTM